MAPCWHDGAAGRVGRQPRAPRRRRWRRAGVDARRRDRDRPGGAAAPADAADAGGPARCCSRTRARRPSGRRSGRAGRRQRRAASTASPRWPDAPFDEVLAYGERRCGPRSLALPDGEWIAEDVLDSTGAAADQQRPALIAVHRARRRRRDRRSTSPAPTTQRPGNINAVRAVTVSAVAFALRSVIDPTLPANDGAMAPVRCVTGPATIVDARYPAAVGAGNVEVSQRVADVRAGRSRSPCRDRRRRRVAGHDEQRADRRRRASTGQLGVLRDGRRRTGRPTAATRRAGLGSGAGMSGVHTGMTNTLNTPVEALERAFPMRVLRYTAAAGERRRGRGAGRRRDRARPRGARRTRPCR